MAWKLTVSAQPTHLESIPAVSQDRVHANHRGHHAQRIRDIRISGPAQAPHPHAPVQMRTGGGLPTAWCVHRGLGGATRHERQCAAPLAQRAPARRTPLSGGAACAPYPWSCRIRAALIVRANACWQYSEGQSGDQNRAAQGRADDGRDLARPCGQCSG